MLTHFLAGLMAVAVWLALVLVHFCFGLYGVILAKFSKKDSVDPLVFCLFRDAGAFPVLIMAALVAEK